MTLTLSPELEARLRAEAARRGMDPSQFAAGLIEKAMQIPHEDQATLDLLAKWDAEDATDDPAEIERQRREGEEFMQGLNRNRLEMEGPNSRKPWP